MDPAELIELTEAASPKSEDVIEQQEKLPEPPAFLWSDGEALLNGTITGTDVTEEYNAYVEALGKQPDSLPSFLDRADDGSIYMAAAEDEDVTVAWERWISSIH